MPDSTTKEAKIAIIGCGRHSTANIFPSLRFAPFDLIATCDLDEEKAKRNARKFGARRWYTDYREMFEREDLDGVIIVINAKMHYQIGIEAMRAGFHVFTEKPPSTTSDEALEAVQVSRETGKTMMTAFKKRYAPAYVRCKEIIRDKGGTRGFHLNISYVLGGYGRDDEAARRFLFDAGIHIIDLANFLLEDIEEVYTVKTEGHASYLVSLRCKSGGIGSLSMSSEGVGGNAYEKLELIGHQTLTVVENVINLTHYDGRERSMFEMRPRFATSGNWTEVTTGFAGELRAFADLILEGRKPPSEISASYKSMVLYEAIRDLHGKVVNLRFA
jgi:predicted dehydrogenase